VLKGERQLQARFTAMGQTDLILKRVVIKGVANAKQETRRFRKTGNLGRTIRVGRVTKTTGSILAGGVNNVGYAGVVERGSRPHIIRAKNRKALAWGGSRTLAGGLRSGSRPTHFAKSVNHPGTKPQPYLVPGLKKAAQDEFGVAVVEQWNKGA
jgi:hypothetical protein